MKVEVEKEGGIISWGTGFVISKDLIITCSHVIDQFEKIELKIPDEKGVFNISLKAKLYCELKKGDGDIAVLQIINAPYLELIPLPLFFSKESRNSDYITFGFPYHSRKNGFSASGKILSVNGNDNNGINSIELDDSNAIEGGYSGAPIFDREIGGVIGVVIQVPSEYRKNNGNIIKTNRGSNAAVGRPFEFIYERLIDKLNKIDINEPPKFYLTNEGIKIPEYTLYDCDRKEQRQELSTDKYFYILSGDEDAFHKGIAYFFLTSLLEYKNEKKAIELFLDDLSEKENIDQNNLLDYLIWLFNINYNSNNKIEQVIQTIKNEYDNTIVIIVNTYAIDWTKSSTENIINIIIQFKRFIDIISDKNIRSYLFLNVIYTKPRGIINRLFKKKSNSLKKNEIENRLEYLKSNGFHKLKELDKVHQLHIERWLNKYNVTKDKTTQQEVIKFYLDQNKNRSSINYNMKRLTKALKNIVVDFNEKKEPLKSILDN